MCLSLIALPHGLQHVTAAHVVHVSVTATQGNATVMTMLLGRSVIAARQNTMALTPVRFVNIILKFHLCLSVTCLYIYLLA
jgi:hypothetical protein